MWALNNFFNCVCVLICSVGQVYYYNNDTVITIVLPYAIVETKLFPSMQTRLY